MADLTTSYMGLKLKNPLLAASCSLSRNVDAMAARTELCMPGENVLALEVYRWPVSSVDPQTNATFRADLPGHRD